MNIYYFSNSSKIFEVTENLKVCIASIYIKNDIALISRGLAKLLTIKMKWPFEMDINRLLEPMVNILTCKQT